MSKPTLKVVILALALLATLILMWWLSTLVPEESLRLVCEVARC